jgi:hypothetical protein
MRAKRAPNKFKYALCILLCCIIPLAALAATVFLNMPVVPTALIALALLIPLGYRLLGDV